MTTTQSNMLKEDNQSLFPNKDHKQNPSNKSNPRRRKQPDFQFSVHSSSENVHLHQKKDKNENFLCNAPMGLNDRTQLSSILDPPCPSQCRAPMTALFPFFPFRPTLFRLPTNTQVASFLIASSWLRVFFTQDTPPISCLPLCLAKLSSRVFLNKNPFSSFWTAAAHGSRSPCGLLHRSAFLPCFELPAWTYHLHPPFSPKCFLGRLQIDFWVVTAFRTSYD